MGGDNEIQDYCEDCGEFYEACDCDDECADHDGLSDVEADADALASAGLGTDEDYGCGVDAEGF
jgi:hypothetical protein